VDDLVSSLRNARGKCQEQAGESTLALLPLQRLELSEARFEHLAAARQSLSTTQAAPLFGDKRRQILTQLLGGLAKRQLPQSLSQILPCPAIKALRANKIHGHVDRLFHLRPAGESQGQRAL